MHHDDFNPQSALIPVFFGHGFPFTSQMWTDIFIRMFERNDIMNRFWLVPIDFIGFGDREENLDFE